MLKDWKVIPCDTKFGFDLICFFFIERRIFELGKSSYFLRFRSIMLDKNPYLVRTVNLSFLQTR